VKLTSLFYLTGKNVNEMQETARNLSGDLFIALVNARDSGPRMTPTRFLSPPPRI
jgi:hypothetical protein